jgi:ATP-dependent DNA helicase DinG
MRISCKTVWTTVVGGRLACVTRPAAAAEGGAAGPGFVVTNDAEALRGLVRDGLAVPVEEVYRLAFPASGAETLKQMAAEQGAGDDEPPPDALWRVWAACAARLAALPLWALEQMALLLREADDEPLSKLVGACAEQVRLAGRNCGGWSDSFVAEPARHDARALPALADCTPLTPDRLAAFAAAGGALARVIPGYESRPGQIAMIRAVAGAINGGKHVLVEAGTGVGKSVGYLLPAIAWSMLNDTPVVVSTNTRNLQTQLIEKDIPLIRAALGPERGGALRAVLLKGRANYLCLRHFGMMLDQGMLDLDRPGLRQFARVIAWAAQTADGDLDSFLGGCGVDGAFAATLGSLGEECAGRACRHFRRCFVRRVRDRAQRAHIVVANHALVFIDAGENGAALPPHAQVIFDEAHNLEDAATRHFSIEVTANRLRVLLRRIFAEHKGRASGILESLRKQLEQGGVGGKDKGGAMQELRRLAREAKTSLIAVREAGGDFFEALPQALQQGRETCRIRGVAGAATGETTRTDTDAHGRTRTAEDGPKGALGEDAAPAAATEIQRDGGFRAWTAAEGRDAIVEAAAGFTGALRRTAAILDRLATALGVQIEGELGLYADQVADVGGAALTLKQMACDIDLALHAADPEYVFWIGRARPARQPRGRVSAEQGELWAAPLSVGQALEEQIYRRKSTVVFCSATLRVGSSFDFVARRLGVDRIEPGRLTTCLAASPFDFVRQCEALAAPFLPEPRSGQESSVYVEQLAGLMLDVFTVTRGRSLALFTSYQMMQQCADLLRQPLTEAGIRLLMQAKGISRDQITRSFRSGGASVLFGAQSFWEGVDVVGEALSCVVIARLPFLAVGDPVVEARCERIDAGGGSSFREFSVPSAVIRFRQGFGRLIRSTQDRGLVVIADPRIVTKNYGKRFRDGLPCPLHAAASRDELLQRVGAFLNTP